MAEQKPIVVFFPSFSTIPRASGIDHSIRNTDAAIDCAEQDAQFKHTHGMSRADWDAALSLHLHGDLQ